jgi:hypothetical protein
MAFGNKDKLLKTMNVLDNLNGDGEPDAAVIISNLKDLSENIREAAEPYTVDALLNGLPPMEADRVNVLAGFIRTGQHEVKTSLLHDAQRLEMMSRTQDSSPVNTRRIHEWWNQTYTKYKQWLAVVEAVTAH